MIKKTIKFTLGGISIVYQLNATDYYQKVEISEMNINKNQPLMSMLKNKAKNMALKLSSGYAKTEASENPDC